VAYDWREISLKTTPEKAQAILAGIVDKGRRLSDDFSFTDECAASAWFDESIVRLQKLFERPDFSEDLGKLHQKSTTSGFCGAIRIRPEFLRFLAGLQEDLELYLEHQKSGSAPSSPVPRTPLAPPANGSVFIGHGRSNDWKDLDHFLTKKLRVQTGEFNSESAAGVSTVERLEQLLEQARFAFLVMTAEDDQPDGTKRARENVVHEVGLFQGRLGFRRAIVLLQQGCPVFSNILGLTVIEFPPGEIKAAFHDIEEALEREGIIKPRPAV
jgi:predicted nucleotide-binding protein